jgi:hypothetical protein
MNNQAAQTIPSRVQERELIRAVLCKELDTNIESDERTYTIAVRAANALHWRQAEIDQLKAQVAALSQPAGVPFGHAMFNAEGKCIGFRQNTGFGYNFTVADFLRADKIMPHGAPHTGCLVYAAAPAASGGDQHNGVTQPDGSGFRHGDNGVGALPEALPKPQVANPADTTYPSPPSGASQSSNPNPVTPGLSSESGASVSERAREIVTFINGRCTNEEAGRKCLGFFVQYGDHLIRALSSPRQEGGSTATSTQGLRELADRWDALAMKFAAMGSDIAMAEAASMRNNAKELRALLTSPTTGVDGGVT